MFECRNIWNSNYRTKFHVVTHWLLFNFQRFGLSFFPHFNSIFIMADIKELINEETIEELRETVPVYKCWWSYSKSGCSLVNPDSEWLDFNKYGWLYIGGGVLILFLVFGLIGMFCKRITPKYEKGQKVQRLAV